MRPETRFLVRFFALLALFFALAAPRPMEQGIIVPFTSAVTGVSGAVGRAVGLGTEHVGTRLVSFSPRFAVDVKNGCNAIETCFLFAAAVLAFPARWREKLAALVAGLLIIQVINVARIVVLFALGARAPALFNATHTIVAPAIVVLVGVGLFLAWALRVTRRAAS